MQMDAYRGIYIEESTFIDMCERKNKLFRVRNVLRQSWATLTSMAYPNSGKEWTVRRQEGGGPGGCG